MKNATDATKILKNRYKRPKGKLVKTGNEEHDARYYTYKHWRYFGWSSFLTMPIGKWRFMPRVVWEKDEKGFLWLWLHFRWNKSWTYVERIDWQLQNKMNQITNAQIDAIHMGQKGPPSTQEIFDRWDEAND